MRKRIIDRLDAIMTHPVTPWVLCALAALMLAVTAADMWAGAPDQIARYQ